MDVVLSPPQVRRSRPANASGPEALRTENQALPDVMLVLDTEGIIRDATLSNLFAAEGVADWIGSPWADTVSESDSEGLRRMLEYARETGVCAFRNVTQHFPSGLQLPVEYTTVLLGGHTGLLAVGKNLRAVAELQSRLVEAQQAMERDYWKLREVETRYRLLFNSSRDAVLLLRAGNLRIVDLNPAAAQALGIAVAQVKGAADLRFPEALMPAERDLFDEMLRRIRERGKAPGVLFRLGPHQTPWLVHASLVSCAQEEVLLVQLAPVVAEATLTEVADPVRVEDLIEGGPDGFVVINHEGTILRANRAFLEQVQLVSETTVLGEPLGRWLGRPGADLTVLLANVVRLGAVRLFSTVLHGALGAELQAEISAAGRGGKHGGTIGVFIRDVSRRLTASEQGPGLEGMMESLNRQIGKTTLRKLVDDTVAVVEQRYIEAALDLTGGNRTAAAELLGLSRQSLYVKLGRYGLEDEAKVVAGVTH
ncbi:transcriptional regulator PpsR [uncultured Thiodictyon sp.]|uniref:transcriptional regulator PpsR n=2 Tax=uncultured Thiodictyon sp. TaxID=1846217 RepID=UPI0025E2C1D4|nr:transcriptional regulator PpsR [uncultured Thiodictyon sp.]